MLELTNHLDRKPANLSGGQRQRVAMGRAIVRSPKAFLMDEPLSNLDAKLRVQMRTQVARIQKTLATTTLYVTHDQTEAMTLGDRVVVMRGGLVQQVGSPTDLYETPNNLFVAGFIGSPSMNFLPATIEGDTLNSGLGNIPMTDRIAPCRREEQGQGGHRRPASRALRGRRAGRRRSRRQVHGADRPRGVDGFRHLRLLHASAARRTSATSTTWPRTWARTCTAKAPHITARLDAAANVRPGEQAELWVNTSKMHVFDAESGANLTAGEAAGVSA